ncbi:MAG: hypothetical protein M1829_006087 [Trizodia sp. TS-e1964]|nr:MAG: hypothetical protein M1829_006087 [Trizodia sp. TS-e1964]
MPNATSCAGRYRGGSTLLPSPGLVRDRLNRFERNIVPSKLPTKASTPRRVFDPDAYFSPLRESHGHPKHHSHHRRRSSSQSPSHSKHVSLQSSIRHHQVVCPSGGIDKPAQVAKVEPKRSWLSIFGVSPSEPSHSHKSKSEVCVSKSVRSINRARQHSSNRATSRAVSRGRSVNASRSSDCGSVTPARNRSGRSASFHDPLITAPPRREPSATGLRPSSALKKRDSKTEETLTTTETLRSSPNGLKSTSRHASGKYSNVGRVSPYAIVPGGIKRTPSRKIIVASVAPLTANGLLSSRAIGTAYYATRNDASSMLSVPASDGAADERDGPLAQSICTHMQLSDGPTSEGCLQCLEDQWHSVKANNQGWKTISLGPVKSTITSNGTVVELEKDFDETVNVRGLSVLIRLEGVPGQAEGIKSRSGTEVGEENVKGDKSWRPELEDGSCMEVGNRRSLRGSATVMALIGDA